MFRIGEFSNLMKSTIKTLRFYDEIGLFRPNYVDENTGYRYYSSDQMDDFIKIKELKELGVSLNDITWAVNGGDLLTILRTRKKELEQELAATEQRLVNIKKAIKRAKGEKKMYTAEIKELPQMMVMVRHGVIASYQEMDKFITEAEKEYAAANPCGKIANPPCCYVEYFTNDYQEKDIEIEYAKAVEECGKETDMIRFRNIEKQKAVCVMHRGCFENLREAYAYASKWAISNGYELCGNGRERFIDGPWNKTSEENYLTEIQLPIKKIDRDNEKRKQLAAEYKSRNIVGGVYAIVNTINNKRIVMSAADIDAAQKRFDFAVATNSATMYLAFTFDWQKQNGKGFAFKVLEILERKDLSHEQFAELLKETEKKYQ